MFDWKITDVHAEDGLIKEVKYHVTATNEGQSVETEGYWSFGDPVLNVPFTEVTEEMVVEWVKKDAIQFGKNIIESRLAEQLEALKLPKVLPPWAAQVFTIGEK
jgi:predicted KAP-like P-loop ATPase